MQQIEPGLRERGRWFRLGVVSATVVTPLVTRWRALRAAERARELWEARRATPSWPWARIGTPAERDQPPPAQRTPVNTGLWLAGVGVGVVAAGAAAFVLARRRIQHADEQPLELPLPGINGNGRHVVDQAQELVGRSTRPARAAATQLDATPATNASSTTTASQSAPAPAATAEQQANMGAATTLESGAPAGVVMPERAPFVGNIRTMVYHEADDDGLPAEDNRVYFASEEEARSAGYRADRGETVESGTEQ
jgi:hypothetical protein